MKEKLKLIGILALYILPLILAVACIVLYFVALIKYANTPVNEAPLWVAWIIFGER